MKMTKKTFLILSLVACAFAADAEKMPYEPYETIIKRQMFGPLPADFDPTKMPSEVAKSSSSRGGKTGEDLTKEEQQLKSAVNFSMINVTPEGEVKVGFTDNSDKKTPRNYYMGVGEERDGWFVKEANPSNATMTIVKNEIEVTLKVGGDSAKDAGATSRAETSSRSPGRSPLLGGHGLSRKEQRAKLMADNAEMRKKMDEMQKQREEDRVRREEEDARRKAEEDAAREESRKELENLRLAIRKDREKANDSTQEEKTEEDSGNENNDAQ